MLDKYKAAATVANSVLEAIKAKAVEGANLLELCAEGDKLLEAGTAGLYNKAKGMPKGELWSLVFVAAGFVAGSGKRRELEPKWVRWGAGPDRRVLLERAARRLVGPERCCRVPGHQSVPDC